MLNIKFSIAYLIIFFWIFGLANNTLAADFYVTQNASGNDNGLDCANAHSATWFNSSNNWANPKQNAKIGPGDMVHLCGIFTGTNGQTMLTIQGSGLSGNQITIFFEPDAVLTNSYWGSGGAIGGSDKNYIVIDGGQNGTIRATDNGSASLGYNNQAFSNGIYINGCQNWEIKNLSIRNMYVREQNDTSDSCCGASNNVVSGVEVWGNSSSLNVHHNAIDETGDAINVAIPSGTMSNIQIHHNTLHNASHFINVNSTTSSSSISDLKIYDNDISGGSNWLDPPDVFHADGIMVSTSCNPPGSCTSNFSGLKIYNNYIHPNWYEDYGGGRHATAHIFVSQDSNGTFSDALIYNNVMTLHEAAGEYADANGFIEIQGGFSGTVANNTIIGRGPGYGVRFNEYANGGRINFQNNIINNVDYYITIKNSSLGSIDYNLYYSGATKWELNGSAYSSITAWRTALDSPNETHSSEKNPSLSASFAPDTASDPTVDTGISLTSFFSIDKDSISRPQGPAWDIGAYEYVESGSDDNPPAQPTGLTVW
jgi:hypothetical protein